MRTITASPRLWLGTGALFFVAVSLTVITLPATDAWHDQWREYANRTQLAGHCSDPLYANNRECDPSDHRYKIEPWMIVPWLLTAGCFIGSMAVAWPFVRRRKDA